MGKEYICMYFCHVGNAPPVTHVELAHFSIVIGRLCGEVDQEP